mmetsp:Transcript_12090/g.28666  ORF Transcript_12090/g.28666 Transcript_12090/m.28666 type:complete len:840 (+) Transcript_12090:83-2602(+)|eukprot:CAMPEP_0197175240 /NCGR_PEP_ID=MMETSP1423-20130617/1509_1 /TAXON_ID=476441 /ORGANISM="Pseudo-nitzschia heimii, Strain UNC1101" /LENGTH=839 /DNA_ID=CAMNT_0042624345 /DNA_START=27 /DNA_END=2546 /DNA_ORIENTATION=-
MGKQTKRTRKFISSGGVKGRLQKGTITSKGSLKRKSKKNATDRCEDKGAAKRLRIENAVSQYMAEKEQRREEGDFVSKKNLGDLDMNSFFETFGDDDSDVNDNVFVDDDNGDDVDLHVRDEHSDHQKESVVSKWSDRSINSDSDSEEGDIEEAERRMKEEMGKLENKDPEFHQFLREHEDSLLDYGADEIHDDGDYDEKKNTKIGESVEGDIDDRSVRLTKELLAKLEKGAFKYHGIKALKKLVNAYKSACHMTDQDKPGDKRGFSQRIESSDVFDRLMVVSLKKCKDAFHYHLLRNGSIQEDIDEKKIERTKNKGNGSKEQSNEDQNNVDDDIFDPEKPINPKILERSDHWNDFNKILYTFFKSTTYILSEAKDSKLIVFVLKALFEYIPYMTPFPRLSESMLKILTSLWSAPIDSSEDYQVVRLHAFLRIRQLAMTQPFPFIEECLKKLYLAYAKRAKFATTSTVTSAMPTLTFMGNCVVELYSLDYHSSYQHVFIYIRQLALLLRTAMQKKTPEAMGAVYCWQYLHCLKLWVAVLTETCQSNDDLEVLNNSDDKLLRSLIFPLTQVVFGTARLIPSTRYLPLRLHCVRLLQQLAAAAEIFLPTTSILIGVFDLQELSQLPKKKSKNKIQPMALTLRLRADTPLRSMEEMEMCLSEVFVLLNREVDLYRYSTGFPEFSVRICQRLRKFCKQARNVRWRAYAKGCIELCERYSKEVVDERASGTILIDVAPKDVKQLEVLRPHSIPSMGLRHKRSLEKEKRLEVASKPIQSKSGTGSLSGREKENVELNDSTTRGSNTCELKNKKREKSKFDKLQEKRIPLLDQADELVEGINWSDEE